MMVGISPHVDVQVVDDVTRRARKARKLICLAVATTNH